MNPYLQPRERYSRRRFLDIEEQNFFETAIASAPTAIYACFTFRHEVSEENAEKLFKRFIKELSLHYKENIAWIRATEVEYSGCSDLSVRRHFHAILLSVAPISALHVQMKWNADIGNSKSDPYDLAKNGIGYIRKKFGEDGCDWDFSNNLHLFYPHSPKNSGNARMRRRQHARVMSRYGEGYTNGIQSTAYLRTSSKSGVHYHPNNQMH